MKLLAELKRRNVFRVAAAYLVASWLIVQVVSAIREPLGLPVWFETMILVLLAIAFPFALILAWAYELTPDGVRPERSESDSGSERRVAPVDYLLVGGLFAVVGMMAWTEFRPLIEPDTPAAMEASGNRSIAVLPFVDMSPERDQEYLGDGIAEQLLDELNNLDGLRVAGRTSSFTYKHTPQDLKSIGETLGVDTILEGSVRKSGDRVRITAQLINAADGFHLWSETYDRDLVDIFAIQEDISSAVAGALGVRLGVGSVNDFRGAGTRNLEAYEAYLQRDYERAVQLDPDYAAAWARLGVREGSTMWNNPPERAPEIIERALEYTERALELDKDSATANEQYAILIYATMDWIRAEEAFQKAIALSPESPTSSGYGSFLMRAGRSREAWALFEMDDAASSIPRSPTRVRFDSVVASSDFEAARAFSDRFTDWRRDYSTLIIALSEKDSSTARTALASRQASTPAAEEYFRTVAELIDSPARLLEYLRQTFENDDAYWPSKYQDIAVLAAYVDEPEFALEVFSREARKTTIRFGTLWYPVMSNVRALPGFKQLVTDLNLVDYWKQYGWADHCEPVGNDDLRCF